MIFINLKPYNIIHKIKKLINETFIFEIRYIKRNSFKYNF